MQLICIPHSKGLALLPPLQIIRVQASNSYSKIYMATGQVLVVAKVLNWFQDLLPTDMFVRVHRSHLVNKAYMTHISRSPTLALQLSNGDTVAISRRNMAKFRA